MCAKFYSLLDVDAVYSKYNCIVKMLLFILNKIILLFISCDIIVISNGVNVISITAVRMLFYLYCKISWIAITSLKCYRLDHQ